MFVWSCYFIVVDVVLLFRYGPGLVVYWFGFVETLSADDRDVLVLADFPKQIRALSVGPSPPLSGAAAAAAAAESEAENERKGESKTIDLPVPCIAAAVSPELALASASVPDPELEAETRKFLQAIAATSL